MHISDVCGLAITFAAKAPYHDLVLLGWVWDLHPPGAANSRMGNISIAANFVTCINYDYTFVTVICEHSCHLPDDGCLAYPCLCSALLRAPLT